MKKSRKIILTLIPVLLVCMLMVGFGSNIFADELINTDINKNPNYNKTANGITNVNNAVNSAWATVLLVLQIAAVGAIVFAGVRYMFASANTKADIKGQMLWLAVGAIITFAASTVVSFLITATEGVLGNGTKTGMVIERNIIDC